MQVINDASAKLLAAADKLTLGNCKSVYSYLEGDVYLRITQQHKPLVAPALAMLRCEAQPGAPTFAPFDIEPIRKQLRLAAEVIGATEKVTMTASELHAKLQAEFERGKAEGLAIAEAERMQRAHE